MNKKGNFRIRNYILLLFLSISMLNGSFAQHIDLQLADKRDCTDDMYCVSIKIKSDDGSLSIGTSSIFLQYNTKALSYFNYTSTHFDGSDQCIQDLAASWDVQTYDATSAPGNFNVTMTLLKNEFSCPLVTQEAIEVGTLCFSVVDDQKSPQLRIVKNNTSFNSSEPNTGEQLIPVGQVDKINDPKALQCGTKSIDCSQQKELWKETDHELFITDCNEKAVFCTGISFNNRKAYEVQLNDKLVADYTKCETGKTTFFYTYSSLLKLEEAGSFEVNWTINGTDYNGSFTNKQELEALLQKWDSDGKWTIQSKRNSIAGGVLANEYGPIELKNTTTGLSIRMGLNKKISDFSAGLLLSEGIHTIIAKNKHTQCEDAITVTVVCENAAEERIAETVIEITSDTLICLQDYISENDFIEDCTDQAGTYSVMTVDNQCLSLLANAVGSDKYCLYICDQDDNCKTLHLTVKIEETLDPVLRDDIAAVMVNVPTRIDVLENDAVNGEIVNFEVPYQRMEGTLEVDEFAQEITYTSSHNICGIQDSFQYKIITDQGQSIAKVWVEILCEELTAFSGFSPNGDGVNDYFKIMGIENFEENELVIFNSRGNEVYSKQGYQNEDGWDGTWKGKMLPDGTYFYMLKIKGRPSPDSGYIQLQR